MVQLGYALSSEEHSPLALVRHAQEAEAAGFTFALISDHFHPWISRQGHSPFVWSVVGGIAQATTHLRLGTGVTCPTVRIHPAILAQAAATAAAMMPGRFFFGVGTGENLNEHITGARWPPFDIRLDMFEEALNIMRLLWQGDTTSYWGEYYTTVAHFEQAARLVDEARATETIPCGPDAARHIERIQQYIDAGYEQVYIHQIGPDQAGFLRFYAQEILPQFTA